MIALGLLIGFLIIGPALAWLAGMFNPIGFIGVLPWKVPASARAAGRENRVWTPEYHAAFERRTSCTETASCEDGYHTYSWPCDLASTDVEKS